MEPHTFDDLMNEIMMEMEEKGMEPDHKTLMHFVRQYPEHRNKLSDFFAVWGVQKFWADLADHLNCQQDRCCAVYKAGGNTMRVFSADNFFVDPSTGVYNFRPMQIGEAHAACLRAYVGALQAGAHSVTIMRGIPGSGKSTWIKENAESLDIVVDNTSPNVVDVAPYAALAQAFLIPYEVVTLRVDPKVAAPRNVHGVPAEFVEKCAGWLDRGTAELMPWWPKRIIDTYPPG